MLERTVDNGLTSYRFTDDSDIPTSKKTLLTFNKLYKFFYDPMQGFSNVFIDSASMVQTYYLKGQVFQDYTITESRSYYLNELIGLSLLNNLCLAQGEVIIIDPLDVTTLGKVDITSDLGFKISMKNQEVVEILMFNSLSSLQVPTFQGSAFFKSYVIIFDDVQGTAEIRGF